MLALAITLIYCHSHKDKLQFRPLWLNWKTTTIFHTQFPPDKLDTRVREVTKIKKKKKENTQGLKLWAGTAGCRLVICRAMQCIWFHKLGFVKAEGILVTWGRNKACALLEEPVAAVVTFMAQEERCWSRGTICDQTTAVSGHTQQQVWLLNVKGNVF